MERLEERIKSSINAAMDPYAAFNNKTIEDYKKLLIASGFDPEELDDPDELYDQLNDDLDDDFHNCGGMVLNRMADVIKLYPMFNEEQQKNLVERLVKDFIVELEAWQFE